MKDAPGFASAVRRVGLISWSLLGTLLFLAAVVWGIAHVANLLPAVFLAIVVIYVFNPVVNRLQMRGIPRLTGSCLSYLALGAITFLLGYLAWPSVSGQAGELGEDFPNIYNNLVSDAEGWVDNVGINIDLPRYDELSATLREATTQGGPLSVGKIGDITFSVLQFVLLLILAPVLAFYVLMDLPRIRHQTVALIPESHRGEIVFVSRQLSKAIGGFLRGQVVVALIVGVMTSVGFFIIGLKFWLLIGMIAGFLNIIPFVGPWVGGALGVLVALATGDASTALWAAFVAALVQQMDNHFISPNVLRVTVKLHPSVIIVALLIGATLGGFLGVLLAVPLVAMLKIVFGHVWRTRVLGVPWEVAAEKEFDLPAGAAVGADVVDTEEEPGEGDGAGEA